MRLPENEPVGMKLEDVTQRGLIRFGTDRVREGLPLPFRYAQEYPLTFRREGVFHVFHINEKPDETQLVTFFAFPVTASTCYPPIVSVKFGYSTAFRTNLHDGSSPFVGVFIE